MKIMLRAPGTLQGVAGQHEEEFHARLRRVELGEQGRRALTSDQF